MLLGRLVPPHEEAPELEPILVPCELQLGHDQLITDGALDGPIQHAVQLAEIEALGEAPPARVPLPGIG
eukprot:15357467-Alexandrium_andersonii.AAC.1